MSIGVGLGLADFPFDGVDGFWRWVGICEDGGVDSIWQTDRLVSSAPILECMSVMAALAGATKRIKFGMNVVSVGMRDPLLLAKQCATIDVLSAGRLLPAFGIGNIRSPIWRAAGLDTKGRGARTDEGLEIIARLWRDDAVSFEGKYYHYSDARISPKPVQQPLPLWLGGSSTFAVERCARFGTGWLGGLESVEEVATTVRAIKQATAAHGRRIDDDHYGAAFAYRFGNWDDPVVERSAKALQSRTGRDPKGRMVAGDAGDIVARLQDFLAAGASKFVLRPIALGEPDVIDQTRRLIDEVLPEVAAMNARGVTATN